MVGAPESLENRDGPLIERLRPGIVVPLQRVARQIEDHHAPRTGHSIRATSSLRLKRALEDRARLVESGRAFETSGGDA